MGRDAAADAAYTEFAVACRARLRSTAHLLCGDWERASDHVQEGPIRVYVAWPRLVRQGGELAYARDLRRNCLSTQRPKPSTRVTSACMGNRPRPPFTMITVP